jgi:modulator of FtsH protease
MSIQTLPAQAPDRSGVETSKVLRNTYLLLGISMIPTVIGALVGMLTGFNLFSFGALTGFLLFLGIAFSMMYAIGRTKESALGVVLLLAFTFFMGLMLANILGFALSHYANGGTLIVLAAGGTAVIFFALSGIAATTKRDFSNLGKFLFVGIVVVFALILANIFLQIPALHLAISGIALVLFSGYLLYDVNRIVRGGETNYIMATLNIYLDIYNIFLSLLRLLMAFAGED